MARRLSVRGLSGIALRLGAVGHIGAGSPLRGEPDGCFSGLAESLAVSTEEEATAAATTVLAHVLDLLVVLLGEDLGMKPIRKLWPRATSAREIDE
jgi:hypothetical protein